MVSTRQEKGKGTPSEHCLLFNLAGCEQGGGALVGSFVSIAFVFIFWNTFKVYILEWQLLLFTVAPNGSRSTHATCAMAGHTLLPCEMIYKCRGSRTTSLVCDSLDRNSI